MSDIPFTRNHYGDMDIDPDELASIITGNTPPQRPPSSATNSPPPGDDEVDADTLLQGIYSNPHKYGR